MDFLLSRRYTLTDGRANNIEVFRYLVVMKIRRFGDTLLRPGSSPLLSCLAPAIPTSAWAASSSNHCQPPLTTRRLDRRCLNVQASLQQSQSTATKISDESISDVPAPPPSKPKSREPQDYQNTISDLMASLKVPRSAKHAKTTRPRPTTDQNSADLIRTAHDEDRGNLIAQRQGSLLESFAAADGHISIHDLLSKRGAVKKLNRPPEPLRLDAYMGRSVAVKKGLQLSQALRFLDIKCSVNRVRQDARYQRFHERPGLKRKRLKHERWAKRFKEGFRATVRKVQRMRNQGW